MTLHFDCPDLASTDSVFSRLGLADSSLGSDTLLLFGTIFLTIVRMMVLVFVVFGASELFSAWLAEADLLNGFFFSAGSAYLAAVGFSAFAPVFFFSSSVLTAYLEVAFGFGLAATATAGDLTFSYALGFYFDESTEGDGLFLTAVVLELGGSDYLPFYLGFALGTVFITKRDI